MCIFFTARRHARGGRPRVRPALLYPPGGDRTPALHSRRRAWFLDAGLGGRGRAVCGLTVRLPPKTRKSNACLARLCAPFRPANPRTLRPPPPPIDANRLIQTYLASNRVASPDGGEVAKTGRVSKTPGPGMPASDDGPSRSPPPGVAAARTGAASRVRGRGVRPTRVGVGVGLGRSICDGLGAGGKGGVCEREEAPARSPPPTHFLVPRHRDAHTATYDR